MPAKHRGRGRPKKLVDAGMVLKLARLGATAIEIGDVVGVHADTISRNYAAQLSKGRADLRISLRRRLLKVAMQKDASVAALIFCAKAYCQLSEEPAVEPASVEFIVHQPSGRVPCSCLTGVEPALAGCAICHGSGYLSQA